MSRRFYQLKRHLSVVPHSPDCVELRQGVWNPVSHTLTDESGAGTLYRLIAGLDGATGAGVLARRVGVSRSDVEALIDRLISLDVVETDPPSVLDHYLNVMTPVMGPEPPAVENRPPVVVAGDAALADEIARRLSDGLPGREVRREPGDSAAADALRDARSEPSWLRNGVELHTRLEAFKAWEGAFVVYASAVIHPVQLRAVNRVSLALKVPWLHVTADGPFLFVGPLFIPGRTACYECFDTRVTMNLREAASYQKYKSLLATADVRVGEAPPAPLFDGVLTAHAALEAANFAMGGYSFTVGKVLAIYLPTMEMSFSEILRVPGCPGSGSSPERDDTDLFFDFRAIL